MKYRTLGKTGLKISEVGFGAWGIGKGMWGSTSDKESLHALQTAVDLGVNFIDTALIYGDDLNYHSEKIIGSFLKTLPKDTKVYVATKIYPQNRCWPADPEVPIEKVFPKKWIYEAVELSLQNLGVASIDLMQFHVWQDAFAESKEWQDAVQDLTRQGKVKHWGISVNDYEPANCLKTLDTGLISTIQFIFNIFHQDPELNLLPYCEKHNLGLIARVPLDEGGLTGTITPATVISDWRQDYFQGKRKKEVYEKVEHLKIIMGPEAETVAELALRWVMSHPQVSTVIPGMRTKQHVVDNCQALEKGSLPAPLMKELKLQAWERNFYE